MAWNRLAIGIPLLLLAVVALAVVAFDPLAQFGQGLPPEEALVVERVNAGDDGIVVRVRGDGRDPVQIAQVQIDGAYWSFHQEPAGPLARLAAAKITVPYPWVAGEAHHLRFVTSTGATAGGALCTPPPRGPPPPPTPTAPRFLIWRCWDCSSASCRSRSA